MRGIAFGRVVRAGAAGVALALVACSPSPSPSGAVINVTEKDFAITAPASLVVA